MILEYLRGAREAATSDRPSGTEPPAWLVLLPWPGPGRVCWVGGAAPDTVQGVRTACGAEVDLVETSTTVKPRADGCFLIVVEDPALLADPRLRSALPSLAEHAAVLVSPAALPRVESALGPVHHWRLQRPDAPGTSGSPGDGRAAIHLPADAREGSRWARAVRMARRVVRRSGLVRVPDPPTSAAAPAERRLLAPVRVDAESFPGAPALVLPPGESATALPAYVRKAAQDAGIDLSRHHWRIANARQPLSRKAIFLASNPDAPDEDCVVKVSWDPGFAEGLENEHGSLQALAARAPVPADTYPRPLFLARYGRAVITAQSAVAGVPLREKSSGAPTCPYVNDALNWLVEMAAGTFRPREAWAVADALGELVERFAGMHRPRPETVAFLRKQVEKVLAAGSLPTVLLHGDPGENTLLVTPRDDAALVGWESCDREGPPLWDLFWFSQALGAFSVRAAGRRYDVEVFTQQFLQKSDASRLLARVVSAACDRLTLSRDLAEPLFHLSWTARAVRDPRHRDDFAALVERSVSGAGSWPGLRLLRG